MSKQSSVFSTEEKCAQFDTGVNTNKQNKMFDMWADFFGEWNLKTKNLKFMRLRGLFWGIFLWILLVLWFLFGFLFWGYTHSFITYYLKLDAGFVSDLFDKMSQLTHFGFLGFLIFYWSLWGSLYFFLLSFFFTFIDSHSYKILNPVIEMDLSV